MKASKEATLLTRPIALQEDNFTPLHRTPWGGDKILTKYKKDLEGWRPGMPVGESWEFSCDPAFPSKRKGSQELLMELIEEDPIAALGAKLGAKGAAGCQILVKLVNAALPLSLQIHPRDGDPFLKPGECGKPESWLILDAEPGAGIYLGFSRPLAESSLRTLLSGDSYQAAREALQFVPVAAGDYFEIDAGVPHSIGPGICLLEPQRILFGQAGKTYRLWDWGRRYRADGIQDPQGQPRQLHLEEGLRLLDSKMQVGMEYVTSLRRSPEVQSFGSSRVLRYPTNRTYQVSILELADQVETHLGTDDCFIIALVLAGEMRVADAVFGLGTPVFLTAASMPLALQSAASETKIALICPAYANLTIHLE